MTYYSNGIPINISTVPKTYVYGEYIVKISSQKSSAIQAVQGYKATSKTSSTKSPAFKMINWETNVS